MGKTSSRIPARIPTRRRQAPRNAGEYLRACGCIVGEEEKTPYHDYSPGGRKSDGKKDTSRRMSVQPGGWESDQEIGPISSNLKEVMR